MPWTRCSSMLAVGPPAGWRTAAMPSAKRGIHSPTMPLLHCHPLRRTLPTLRTATILLDGTHLSSSFPFPAGFIIRASPYQRAVIHLVCSFYLVYCVSGSRSPVPPLTPVLPTFTGLRCTAARAPHTLRFTQRWLFYRTHTLVPFTRL